MNRYSKIKLVKSTKKSRSIDFSDLQSFPHETTKPIKPQDINFKTQEPKQQINTQKFSDSPPNLEENDELANTHDKKYGTVKLRRNSSVSATTTNSTSRFKLEKQTTTALQNVVKRAFSLRRSSSVSERYCKIHDQCVTLASPFDVDDDDDDEEEEIDDDENNTMQTRSMNVLMMKKKKKKKQRYSSGRILKACKRLFGLY